MDITMQYAKPVFLPGLEETPNVQSGFRRDFYVDALPGTAVVVITARSFYRLYVNGSVVMHGPARTAHGYARVDEVDVLPFLRSGQNTVAVELTASVGCLGGYSNDCTCESSMLLAELWLDDVCALATDTEWDALQLTQRQPLSEKMSHCRQSAEVYCLDADYTAWRTGPLANVQDLAWQKAAVCQATPPQLLPRRMPLPTLEKQGRARLVWAGTAAIDRDIACKGPWFEQIYADHYARLTQRPLFDYAQTVEQPLPPAAVVQPLGHDGIAVTGLSGNDTFAAVYDFGQLRLGFLGFTVSCAAPCTLDVVHLEAISEYDEKPAGLTGANPVTRLHLPAGKWQFLTMEPALVRHVKLYFRGVGADCTVQDLHVREYCYPDTGLAYFHCSDEDINRLYDAAYRTLRLNTLDIFMDCPERERGGWLCDSLWTARAAAHLLGDHSVEKAHIENFLLAPYGDGVGAANDFFPEVYPGSKVPGGPAITTWSFWLMLELAEYVQRTGDLAFALQHQKRVEDFVAGTTKYIGACGLLQDMPYIFIDWSQSNSAHNNQPISTAANALYAYMLRQLGRLYQKPEWTAAGDKVRGILRSALLAEGELDFRDKPYFPDTLHPSADGKLVHGDCYSEACQYTILWAELFEKEEIPLIARSVLYNMGPAPLKAHDPMVGTAQLFIGLCIRCDLLAKWNQPQLLLRELRALYLPQLTEGPGTLWENVTLNNTSRCHGFNAHAAVLLLQQLLGLDIPKTFDLDTRTFLSRAQQRQTYTRPANLCGLRWMRGVIPTVNGLVSREVFDRD